MGLLKVSMLLVLINAVVFLWPSNVNHAPHVHHAQDELKPHFVRLNKEIEERFYSQLNNEISLNSSSRDGTVLVEPDDSESQDIAPFEFLDGGALAQSGNEDCYRLGPFMHRESYELAQAVLFNAGVEYQKSTRKTQESDVLRLFLGPYDTETQASDARLGLTKKRILDHFSRKLDDDTYIISLGIYSSEETADAALRLFADEIDGVKVQSETVVLPNSYWLHFILQRESSKLEQLSGIDWGENSVKLGLHECRV